MSLNPMLWLNMRVNGNISGNFVVVGVFAFLISAIAGASYYGQSPGDYKRLDGIWLGIVSIAQLIFILILAPTAVRKAVLRDFQTGMITSHRISPMSNLKVVLGYLSGAPIQALLLYVTGMVLASVFLSRFAWSSPALALGSLSAAMGGWLLVHACLLTLAVFVAAMVLLSALSTEGKANFAGPLVAVVAMSSWAVITYVPGIALIFGLMGGSAVLAVVRGTPAQDSLTALVLGAALQLPLTMILLAAACRKFRRPWEAMFSLPLALLLLAFLGFAFVLGMHLAPTLTILTEEQGDATAQVGASTAVFMLLTLIPLFSAAKLLARRDAAAAFESTDRTNSRLVAVGIPLLMCAITMTVFDLMTRIAHPGFAFEVTSLARYGGQWTPIFAALLLAAIADLSVCYVLVLRGKRVFWPLAIIMFVLRVAPVILNGVAAAVQAEMTPHVKPTIGLTGAASPLGTFAILLWGGTETVLWSGIGIQALLAALCVAWALSARARLFRQSRASSHRTPPAIAPVA